MSDESSLLALLKLYDQLEGRIAVLEEQMAQMQGDEDEPQFYMDGSPVK